MSQVREVNLAELAIVVGVLNLAGVAQGSFLVYGTIAGWRHDVGGPTILRNAADYWNSGGQSVNPEIWSDVGVHLVSSAPLTTGFGTLGANVKSAVHASFDVRWDQSINSLWYHIQSPTGPVSFYSGGAFLFSIPSGSLGVISTVPFDRVVISFPNANDNGYLNEIEWGVVPGPGALPLLALAGQFTRRMRRRER